jgi:hypothetical protein
VNQHHGHHDQQSGRDEYPPRCSLTSKLSGARPRRPRRSYFIPTHRLPPTVNEDDAARPLQRKLDTYLRRTIDPFDLQISTPISFV